MKKLFFSVGLLWIVLISCVPKLELAKQLDTKSAKVSALDTASVPGVTIAHSAASTGIYLGSPSIVIMDNGDYMASVELQGGAAASKGPNGETVTKIYTSKKADKGGKWTFVTNINGQSYSTLFVHNREVYIIGTYCASCNMIIRKYNATTKTFSIPTQTSNGIIRSGSYHSAPTPVIVAHNRIWKAMEDTGGTNSRWPQKFRAIMMSIPTTSNLLNGNNWTATTPKNIDESFLGGYMDGWLEGNAVSGPGSQMYNVLRVYTWSRIDERVALMKISSDGVTASNVADGHTTDPTPGDFAYMPGGHKKFTIRYDSSKGRYIALTNHVPSDQINVNSEITMEQRRNTLAMISSTDLKNWRVDKILLSHSDQAYHAFQYIDWQFEGNDIIYIARVAYDDGLGGANNYHNANFATFNRLANFRNFL
jgi:hypothetical protein